MNAGHMTPGPSNLELNDHTDVGSYFVATYPPFSVWSPDAVARDARPALASAADPSVPLGVYLHIPFCRKRCHFCYFRVYTDKNAQEVQQYLDVLAREWELYAQQRAVAGRRVDFVYFGGGTPSFLSTQQLQSLAARLSAVASWRDAGEITFECEPGAEAALGGRSLRGARARRLPRAQRVHGRQGSVANEVPLHRSPVAGRRHGRPRRRLVRPRQRRAHAECRHLGIVQRCGRPR